ncbi:hypothetical protein LWC34_08280 [Kibdelosporangium philippinense]|uniref:Uncharacterized protein n=1 Tax=Kibdelosporangium philippinense TaxID=211113 RepID=A0ABS8Z4G8_9PSEU|nr:hypothetical protein [Kibdelosporangium philippinense]MCE7002826.1 hypothetical protein [Kibdelosporangium philippinense]
MFEWWARLQFGPVRRYAALKGLMTAGLTLTGLLVAAMDFEVRYLILALAVGGNGAIGAAVTHHNLRALFPPGLDFERKIKAWRIVHHGSAVETDDEPAVGGYVRWVLSRTKTSAIGIVTALSMAVAGTVIAFVPTEDPFYVRAAGFWLAVCVAAIPLIMRRGEWRREAERALERQKQ